MRKVGRCRAGGFVIDYSGCGHSALHHGPVLDLARTFHPGSVVHHRQYGRKEVLARRTVGCVHGQHSSADGRVRISYAALVVVMSGLRREPGMQCAWIPFFPPMTETYRQVLQTRSYFFLLQWEWYEWVGIFAPWLIFRFFGRIARRRGLTVLEACARRR